MNMVRRSLYVSDNSVDEDEVSSSPKLYLSDSDSGTASRRPKKSKSKKSPRRKISPSKSPAFSRLGSVKKSVDDSGKKRAGAYKESPSRRSSNRSPTKPPGPSFDSDETDEEMIVQKGGARGRARGGKNQKQLSKVRSPKKKMSQSGTDGNKSLRRLSGRLATKPVKVSCDFDSNTYGEERVGLKRKSESVGRRRRRSLKMKPPRKRRYESYDEEEEEEEEEDSDTSSEVESDGSYRQKSRLGKKASKFQKVATSVKSTPKYKVPPTSEMVIGCIEALKDNPKKGSTLRSIKETILLNWSLNMKLYDKKIKKYLVNAIETGEIVRVKGTGFSGRFTVPGLTVSRKKKRTSSGLGKKFDKDDVEYVPKKTQRDEEKEQHRAELEELRVQRKVRVEQLEEEKASRPPKPKKSKPANADYEVEAIKAIRTKNGDAGETCNEYLVKFVGYPKPQWESEENVEGCQVLIDAYMQSKRLKDAEKERLRKLAEEEGAYEVLKIVSMRQKADKREFMVRWKGYGPDEDTWEPEEHLDCKELIGKFMKEWDNSGDMSLREDRKMVQRLQYATSRRRNARGGFRVSYFGMED